jgi:hypothetical protein
MYSAVILLKADTSSNVGKEKLRMDSCRALVEGAKDSKFVPRCERVRLSSHEETAALGRMQPVR